MSWAWATTPQHSLTSVTLSHRTLSNTPLRGEREQPLSVRHPDPDSSAEPCPAGGWPALWKGPVTLLAAGAGGVGVGGNACPTPTACAPLSQVSPPARGPGSSRQGLAWGRGRALSGGFRGVWLPRSPGSAAPFVLRPHSGPLGARRLWVTDSPSTRPHSTLRKTRCVHQQPSCPAQAQKGGGACGGSSKLPG